MPRKPEDEHRLFCPRCSNEVTGEAVGALLGFPRHLCETCSEPLYAPLASRSRLIWWTGAMIGLALADVLLLTGVVVPGLLALVGATVFIAGLLVSTRIRRGHRTRGRNIWLVHLARRTAHISESVVGGERM
jgi:hypothetical protein